MWTLKIRELEFGGKCALITTNLKSRQDCVNQIFTQMHYFSSFSQVLHDITMLFTYNLHILHHLLAMKKIFLICTFNNWNLAEKFTHLAELLEKVELCEVHGVHVFSRSDLLKSCASCNFSLFRTFLAIPWHIGNSMLFVL